MGSERGPSIFAFTCASYNAAVADLGHAAQFMKESFPFTYFN